MENCARTSNWQIVIELDDGDDEGDNKGNNKDTYAAFKAVEVENEVIEEAA